MYRMNKKELIRLIEEIKYLSNYVSLVNKEIDRYQGIGDSQGEIIGITIRNVILGRITYLENSLTTTTPYAE